MTLANAFAMTGAVGIIAIFVFFTVWFFLTVAVLVGAGLFLAVRAVVRLQG